MMSFFPLAERGVKTVGVIPAGLPKLSWPLVHWNELDDLLGLALACFLLSYVESISVVRTFALKHRYAINADQELLALGAANLAAGVGQGFPVAGGMSQSAVNEKAGAQTPLALVFASASICAVLLFLTGLMRNLPQPVLAAVVLFAVGGLVRPREIRLLHRADRMEFRIALVAMLGVLLFGILKGVLLGCDLFYSPASEAHLAPKNRGVEEASCQRQVCGLHAISRRLRSSTGSGVAGGIGSFLFQRTKR